MGWPAAAHTAAGSALARAPGACQPGAKPGAAGVGPSACRAASPSSRRVLAPPLSAPTAAVAWSGFVVQTIEQAVPDGDTVGVQLDGTGATRFLGIDTPRTTAVQVIAKRLIEIATDVKLRDAQV